MSCRIGFAQQITGEEDMPTTITKKLDGVYPFWLAEGLTDEQKGRLDRRWWFLSLDTPGAVYTYYAPAANELAKELKTDIIR